MGIIIINYCYLNITKKEVVHCQGALNTHVKRVKLSKFTYTPPKKKNKMGWELVLYHTLISNMDIIKFFTN